MEKRRRSPLKIPAAGEKMAKYQAAEKTLWQPSHEPVLTF